jgi:anti-sigma factor RsiW
MSDQWTDRLSEYLDDELNPGERAELEAHLRQCVTCAAVLADLERVVARAHGLEDRAPDRDPWPEIAARIGVTGTGTPLIDLQAERQRRRWSFSLPQLAAAGIALMVLSGGAAWLLHPAARSPIAAGGVPASRPGVAAPGPIIPASARTATRDYNGAVADLERVLAEGRGRLDTTTVRVIERNLATIDSAIAQAQRAVADDSANVYLNSHLADTMRRKLELLRQAAALVSSVS